MANREKKLPQWLQNVKGGQCSLVLSGRGGSVDGHAPKHMLPSKLPLSFLLLLLLFHGCQAFPIDRIAANHHQHCKVSRLLPLCLKEDEDREESRKKTKSRQTRPSRSSTSSSSSRMTPSKSTSFPTRLTESFLHDGGDTRPTRSAIATATLLEGTASTTLDLNRVSTGHDWGIHRQPECLPPRATSAPRKHNKPRQKRGRPRIHTPLSSKNAQNDNMSSRTKPTVPIFPDTLEQVAEGAAKAVAYTLTQSTDKQDPNVDPHYLTNLWAGDRYWQDRRPVRTAADRGRVGIEIDGALPGASEAATVRSVSLALAGKLATHPAWSRSMEKDNDDPNPVTPVPVAVYLNTIPQTLAASQELSLRKKRQQYHKLKQQKEEEHPSSLSTIYDTVSILPLTGDAEMPTSLTQHGRGTPYAKDRRKSTKDRVWLKGHVDPRKGLIVVVQPTDFNHEYQPPGPSIGCVSHLQRLTAKASLLGVPVVVVSPRFLVMGNGFGGSDQSGYQQSASFGGSEPPKGPTPWLLRDFGPPVYSWVGSVVKVRAQRIQREKVALSSRDTSFHYSGVSMVQSVLHRQRAWHVFAQRCRYSPKRVPEFDYEYLASTKSGAGRPTREICLSIWQEFASFSGNTKDHNNKGKQ